MLTLIVSDVGSGSGCGFGGDVGVYEVHEKD